MQIFLLTPSCIEGHACTQRCGGGDSPVWDPGRKRRTVTTIIKHLCLCQDGIEPHSFNEKAGSINIQSRGRLGVVWDQVIVLGIVGDIQEGVYIVTRIGSGKSVASLYK